MLDALPLADQLRPGDRTVAVATLTALRLSLAQLLRQRRQPGPGDTSYVERLDINADWMANGCATDAWSYPLRQPVVEPVAERRSASSVLLDLADRVGITPDINAVMNVSFGFREPYLLSDRKYCLEEIVDTRYKSWFGEQFGLAFDVRYIDYGPTSTSKATGATEELEFSPLVTSLGLRVRF